MPRTYTPAQGAKKRYKKYDELMMAAALNAYNASSKSFSEIEKQFGIPKSVLHRHNTRIMKKQGGQTVLSKDIEEYIVENLNHCSEWGYPLDTYDLRLLVKGYLDRIGVNIKKFRDNLPGPDFIKGFLGRHSGKISVRICQNIKRCRAAISPDIIEEYFKELEKSLDGVPLSNIINYDETNLSDDPGRRKVITKRGAKYPERIMNHSKSATSLMMAATAHGKMLPCYVVYKSLNIYPTWMENGPKGCLYGYTKSGWFDSVTFENWVRKVAMPYFRKLQGKKILIGDNLSSHLSIDLIRECKEQNVHFVFLPANSTHLTQPLDVAFFRPMKGAWREILFYWKKSEGRNLANIPKSIFPSLLKKMLNRLEPRIEANILAGFMKTGISPLNKEKVLERLPGNTTRDESLDKEAIDQTVLAMLKEMRYGAANTTKPTNRKKKITLLPGQSVCVDPEEEEENEDPEIFGNVINSEVDSDLNSEAEEVMGEDVTVEAELINEKSKMIKKESKRCINKNKVKMNLDGVKPKKTTKVQVQKKNISGTEQNEDHIFKKPETPKKKWENCQNFEEESPCTKKVKIISDIEKNIQQTESKSNLAEIKSPEKNYQDFNLIEYINEPCTSNKYIKEICEQPEDLKENDGENNEDREKEVVEEMIPENVQENFDKKNLDIEILPFFIADDFDMYEEIIQDDTNTDKMPEVETEKETQKEKISRAGQNNENTINEQKEVKKKESTMNKESANDVRTGRRPKAETKNENYSKIKITDQKIVTDDVIIKKYKVLSKDMKKITTKSQIKIEKKENTKQMKKKTKKNYYNNSEEILKILEN